MAERKDPGLRFHAREMRQVHKIWRWENDGLIAYCAASVGLETLARVSGLKDDEYALTNQREEGP